MMNTSNHDELISSMLDGELSDAQLDALLDSMKTQNAPNMMQTWSEYHTLGDVLRSDDLAIQLSSDFSARMKAKLDAEPVILAPSNLKQSDPKKVPSNRSAYWAITSVAASVMMAFLMAPQLIPLLKSPSDATTTIAKADSAESFTGPGVKLASNSAASTSASSNVSTPVVTTHQAKEAEFAPKLENQVEMLRDPRLDSYLLAHQKVSPSFDNGARYVQRANVVSPIESKK